MIATLPVQFVSIIAIDPVHDEVLLVKKTKGPMHLRDKVTFPGGKIEADDPSAAHAAARELLEECGIEVPPFDLVHLTKKGGGGTSLEVFVAITDLSDAQAQPGEDESIFRASLSQTRQRALIGDPDLAEDTSALLESLFSVRHIQRRLTLVSHRAIPATTTQQTAKKSLAML